MHLIKIFLKGIKNILSATAVIGSASIYNILDENSPA